MIILKALGIGQPGESLPLSPNHKHLFRSAHISPWNKRFRFGGVLAWDGLFWHNAIGIKAKDFNESWLGDQSWRRGFGPIAICRWRRRGSLKCDIEFERNMGCCCQHIIWSWLLHHGRVEHNVLCPRYKDEETDHEHPSTDQLHRWRRRQDGLRALGRRLARP